MDDVDVVKTTVDQVNRGRGDLVIGRSSISGDTRRDCGGSGYATLVRFGGFVLKTMGGRFAKFWTSKNLGMDFGAARGIIGEFVSRQGYFMKGS